MASRISGLSLSRTFRRMKEEKERQSTLIAQETELLQAEGRQAGPFGNRARNRQQNAPGGGGFSPAKGAVSEGAQTLFDGGVTPTASNVGKSMGGGAGGRDEAKSLLDKDLSRRIKELGKKRGGSSGDTSKESRTLLGTAPGGAAKGTKTKLGV